ncbi:unnamed protein product [Lasius platythorax]
MFFCKHCGNEIYLLDNAPKHLCFLEKSIYLENNNILYATEDDKDLHCVDDSNSSATKEYTTEDDKDLHCVDDSNSSATKEYTTEDDKDLICVDDSSAINNSSTMREESLSTSNCSTTKQHALWTRNAILALLALYEAKVNMLDNPKKRGKIWQEIANDLLEIYGIEMTSDQVRWKMNALLKKYKEVIDNFSKSGRGNIEFEWFQPMDDIFGKNKDTTNQNYTVSSKVYSKIDKASTSQPSEKKRLLESSCLPSTTQHLEKKSLQSSSKSHKKTTADPLSLSVNETDINPKQKKHSSCGTASKIAKTKIELEKQWLDHLTMKRERDRIKDEKNATFMENKKELIKLKKKQLAFKEQELQQRREIAENKLKEKKTLYAEILEVEKQKYKVLKRYLDNKENVQNVSSESD